MAQDVSVIAEFSALSSREIEGAGPTTLRIVARRDGSVIFEWSVDTRILASVKFCINAFFTLLNSIPKIFGQLGKPLFFGSCDLPTVLACFHDTNLPEIGLGVLADGDKTPISIVVLDRGSLLTVLDQMGRLLATLEDVHGCGDSENDEPEGVSDALDPFIGINTAVRH